MPNTQTQNKFKKDSKMFFLEKAQWKKGEVIIAVSVETETGEQKPVGYIYLHDYDANKKPIYVSHDLTGNEIFPQSINLYQLKHEFRLLEDELTQAMHDHEFSKNEQVEELLERHSLQEEPERPANEFPEPALDQPSEDTRGEESETSHEQHEEIKKTHQRKNGKSRQQEINL